MQNHKELICIYNLIDLFSPRHQQVTAAQLKQVKADAKKARLPLSKYVRQRLGL